MCVFLEINRGENSDKLLVIHNLVYEIQGSTNRRAEVPYSATTQRARIGPLSSTRNGGRNVGLPPPSKFRSGHLSGVIPVSRVVIPGDLDDSESASDNDMSTDSEGIYGGRYSLDSSPQDDRIPSSITASRYHQPLQRHAPQYASDSMYSDDLSSSKETLGRGHEYVAGRLMRGANRQPTGNSVYTEDESSDSAASSEFSTTQVGSINGTIPPAKNYTSEGCASSVPSRLNTENGKRTVCKQVLYLIKFEKCHMHLA